MAASYGENSRAQLQALAARGLPVLITVSAPKEAGREHFVQVVARAVNL